MSIRRHGVIGGPRQRPPVPKRTKEQQQKIMARKEKPIEVVVVNTKLPVIEVVTVEPDFDEVEDRDKLEDYVPSELDVLPKYGCILCGFVAKSERGLNTHKRMKHPVTEDFELELEAH